MPQLANFKDCTGCLACADACNHNAISIDCKYGLLYPGINTDVCIDCKLCEKACPIVSSFDNDYCIHESTAFATWSLDDDVRMNSASGGFCTAIAIDTIRKGGKVATCSWIKGKPKYILTDCIEDLKTTANCKYVQSDPSGIYRSVREELKKGTNVLFVGLPCHVAGLKTFLKNRYSDLLTTVELICSPPTSMYAVELQNRLTDSRILRFRTKDEQHRWGHDKNLLIRKNNKDLFIENGCHDDIFYKIFSSDLTARKSCMNCRFASFQRQADFTVGDFHGYKNDGGIGVTLVISKNSQTSKIIKEVSNLYVETADIKQALRGNPRFYIGKNMMQYHPAFVWRNAFHRLPESIKLGFLLLKMPYKVLWGFYRVLDKISIRFKSKELDKQLK